MLYGDVFGTSSYSSLLFWEKLLYLFFLGGTVSAVCHNNENGHLLSYLFLTASAYLVESCIVLHITSGLELSLWGVCLKTD